MGTTTSCSQKQSENPDAISLGADAVAYKWFGLHVLSATCKNGQGAVLYHKTLNWS